MTDQPLLTFYGDDFTGSTDAMEALAQAGLRTVLFLVPPNAELLSQRFADVRCVGVAGTSRAMTPQEMDIGLMPMLRRLWSLGAPLLHYKVCSTLDSSPAIGNIGHVIDFARASLNGGRPVSVLAGVPALRRYTIFGNHFAAAGPEIYRLDRHPTMSRHPTTPMDEADLRVHLARQTQAPVSLMSLLDLDGSDAEVAARYAERMRAAPAALLYDVLDQRRLQAAGRLLWEEAQRAQHFVVGSSGVGYALTAHWRASGAIPVDQVRWPRIEPLRQILVLSGSASPMTAQQIAWATQHGFEALRVPAGELAQPQRAAATAGDLLERAHAAFAAGHSVLLYTASGPDDPGIAATRACLASGENSARLLGAALGRIARELLSRLPLRRIVIAGGDTSSYAAQELGLTALEMRAELTPGAPLCRAYSSDARIDGLEVAFKGGQMGGADYFGRARDG